MNIDSNSVFSQKCLELMKYLNDCKTNEIEGILLKYSNFIDQDDSLFEVYKLIGWNKELNKINGSINVTDILKILFNIYQRSFILGNKNFYKISKPIETNSCIINEIKYINKDESPYVNKKLDVSDEISSKNKKPELTEERILELREKIMINRNQENQIKKEKKEIQKFFKKKFNFDKVMNNPYKHNLKKISNIVKNYIIKNKTTSIDEIKIDVLFKMFKGEVDISEKLKIDRAIDLSLKIMQGANFIVIIPKENIVFIKSKINEYIKSDGCNLRNIKVRSE